MSIRIGVIGTGGIGGDHIRRIRNSLSGAVVTAVSDPDTERASASIDGVQGACVVGDGLDLINRSDVDAVLIASPGATHADFLTACLRIRKPVFCEKPLATNVADAWRVF
ncbi:MAG: Gfo/Idh/MocA family oxidoreductase [Acidimicrobiaceae bacterium]|nr:Gfo/Idh/MocA family oxidoreductase [Acidimicrobiaceae bacterium]